MLDQRLCSCELRFVRKGIQTAKTTFVPIVDETPPPSSIIHGRGASWSPANRFEKLHVDLTDVDVVDVDLSDEPPSHGYGVPREQPGPGTQYFRYGSTSILTRITTPDL